jgi:hypothetical protein
MIASRLIQKAQKDLRARNFSKVIAALEPHVSEYRESFDFYYTLGLACLYAGDIGGAGTYFERARKIRLQDPNLKIAQAAYFIRKNEVSKGLEYTLDVLDAQPNDRHAKKMLSLIRKYGEEEIIAEWIRNGKIKKFYPPLGLHPAFGYCAFFIVLVFAAGLAVTAKLNAPVSYSGKRADLSKYALTRDDRQNAIEDRGIFHYEFRDDDVVELYKKIQKNLLEYKDGSAQIACNMIINSNASKSFKQKARELQAYLWNPVPTFDSLKENFDYETIMEEPYRYNGCYVIWDGRVANVAELEDKVTCNFLVGYDTLTNVSGVIPVELPAGVIPNPLNRVKILGILKTSDNTVFLQGIAIYQPLSDKK